MKNMEETQVEHTEKIWKIQKKIVKRYGNYGRNVSRIAKRFGKYRRKL
jgi:hypothetical protein